MTEEERIHLAGEYAIGLLEGTERSAAESLVSRDPAFRRLVEEWRERLLELDQTAPAAALDDALWYRIQDSLGTEKASSPSLARNPSIPSPFAPISGLWQSLSFWRTIGFAGTLTSLLLAIGVGLLAARHERQPALVAVLVNDASHPAALVNAFADGHAEFIPLAGMDIPQDRSVEIWTFPDPKGAPVSVGVTRTPKTIRLQLDKVPNLRPDQLFAISVEPLQGSPTGLPTGPVVMKGTATTAL